MRSAAGPKVVEVYGELKKQIMLARLSPGQQLVELDLAQAMRCSQTTIREALLRLQEDGLIVRNGYRGTVVSPVSEDEAQECLDIRARLEARGALRALPRLDSAALEALREWVRRMEAAAARDDTYALFESDQEFHKALFRASGLPALLPILERCSLYGHRFKMTQTTTVRTLAETASRHWAIVDALERRDPAVVERIVSHHVLSVIGDLPSAATELAPALPSLMSPTMKAIFDRIADEDRHLPNPMQIPVADARRQFERTTERWNRFDRKRYTIDRFTIPGPGHAIPALRIARKGNGRKGTLMYLHGGGWVFGSTETHLGAMARHADLTGLTVIGIDYGLAPEAPFPEGLNDCVTAWRWLRAGNHAMRLAAPWFLAGDSSGANLALALMLDLRDSREPMPDAGLLYYGVFAPDHTTESHRMFGQGQFGLTSDKMAWYRNHYLSGKHTDASDPRVSPVYADLAGLPPLYVNAAGLDPLRDDSLLLARRLVEAGARFQFKVHEGVNHGFMQMSSELPEALTAFEDAATFIQPFLRSRQERKQHQEA